MGLDTVNFSFVSLHLFLQALQDFAAKIRRLLYFLKLAVGAKRQIGELLQTLCQPQSASTEK